MQINLQMNNKGESVSILDIVDKMGDMNCLVIRKRGTNETIVILPIHDDNDGLLSIKYLVVRDKDTFLFSCSRNILPTALTDIRYLYSDEYQVVHSNELTLAMGKKQ